MPKVGCDSLVAYVIRSQVAESMVMAVYLYEELQSFMPCRVDGSVCSYSKVRKSPRRGRWDFIIYDDLALL